MPLIANVEPAENNEFQVVAGNDIYHCCTCAAEAKNQISYNIPHTTTSSFKRLSFFLFE